MAKETKEDKKFLELVQKAYDKGFRKCFIKKVNAMLMFKGKIYFNMTGIYTYANSRFFKLCDFSEENLNKYLEDK